MKSDSLKNNFVFQTLYQLLILVIPLLISPYLTRVLGSTNLGTYTYINSIATYFIVFANLGIAKHGQRIIASRRNDELALRKTFWSLFFLHGVVSLLSVTLYLVFCCFVPNAEKTIYLIQGIYVASVFFDITWLFYGLETFKNVVIKNSVIKVIELILIFVFVNRTDDLWIYTLIISASTIAGHISILPQAIKIVRPVKFSKSDIFEHLKPMLVLFVSVVAATLYTVFDKTLLGLLASKEDVAYYEYANKIINIPKQLIFVIGTVMFPRACKAYADGNFEVQRKYIDISMLITILLGSAFVFGLMAVGKKFAVLYYGANFEPSGDIIVSTACLILIVMIGDVLRSEYLIPAKKDFLFTICIIISAILNIIISFVLIPIVGIYGAVIGTIIAELFGTIYQIICSRKMYPIHLIIQKLVLFVLCGLIMYFVVLIIDVKMPVSLSAFFIEVIAGALIYFLMSMVIIFIFYRKMAMDFFNMFRKKREK